MAGAARPDRAASRLPPSPNWETLPEGRPRQRLLRSGPEALSDPEVLALILGNGCREVRGAGPLSQLRTLANGRKIHRFGAGYRFLSTSRASRSETSAMRSKWPSA